jgi:glycine dehydrogenase subunit 1
MVTAATIYMASMGKQGLKHVSELCYHKAHYAAQKINELADYSVINHQPFFNEFTISSEKPITELNKILFDEYGLIGGYNLEKDYPHLKNHMLLAFTEMISVDDINSLVEALGAI